MSKPVTARPAICLHMIVKDESHIVHEVLDVCAPDISSRVIVDTAAPDETQDVTSNALPQISRRLLNQV